MKRCLRIAVSVFFALVAVAFAVLWVPSYGWIDNVLGPLTNTHRLGLTSAEGWLTVRWKHDLPDEVDPKSFRDWTVQSISVSDMENIQRQMMIGRGRFVRATYSFGFKRDGALQLPHMLPILLAGILATALGIPRLCRFSLRTLLIAMTLIAVVLGLIVVSS